MKINEEIKNFLDSSDTFLKRETDSEQIKFSKENLQDGYKLLYIHNKYNSKNKFSSENVIALCLFNKNNEPIYTPDNGWGYGLSNLLNTIVEDDNERYELKTNSLQLSNTIKDEISKFADSEIKILNPQILTEKNIKNYKEEAIKKYKNNNNVENPIQKQNICITPESIITYLENPKDLNKCLLDCLPDSTIEKYEKYVLYNKCIEEYKEEIENNPKLQKINAILEVLNGDKQSYNINYHTPNGAIKKENFKKNISNMRFINKTMLDYEVLLNIPIEFIDTITWRNNILFDSKNYPKSTFTKDESTIRYGLLNSTHDLGYINDNIAFTLCNVCPCYINDIDASFLNNKEFILKLIKNVDNIPDKYEDFLTKCVDDSWTKKQYRYKTYFYSKATTTVQTDKDFLENYIETFKSTEYNSHLSYYDKDYVENFGNAIKKYINDYDFTKLVLNKVGANKDIIDLIPKRFIEMPDTIKILANHSQQAYAFKRITSLTNLRSVYSNHDIRKHLCDLNFNILNNRDFVKDNITSFALNDTTILELYGEDREIMDKIIKEVSTRRNVNTIIDFFKLEKDPIKKFELASKNTLFLETLSDNDKEIFFDGELADIENINITNNEILITTANCNFKCLNNRIFIYPKDYANDSNKNYYFDDETLLKAEEKIVEILKENYKLRSKLYVSVVNELTTKQKEKNKEVER